MVNVTQDLVDQRALSSRNKLTTAMKNTELERELATTTALLRTHALLVPDQMSKAGIWLDPTSILAHSYTTQKVRFVLSLLFSGLRSPLATVSSGGLVIGSAVASVLQCSVLPIKKREQTPTPRISGKAYSNSTASAQRTSKQLSICIPDVERVIDPEDPDTYVVWLLDDMKDRGRTLMAARELLEGIAVNGVSPRVAGAIVIVERTLESGERNYWGGELPVFALLRGTQQSLRSLATHQQNALDEVSQRRRVSVINGLAFEPTGFEDR